jgi:hypothetical protein
MNLLLGIMWLLGALFLFGYEAVKGVRLWPLHLLNDVSGAWALLILAAWNFVRWYSVRMSRADAEANRIVYQARRRQQERDLEQRPVEPDPAFDFTDRPAAPTPRPPGAQPPSSN